MGRMLANSPVTGYVNGEKNELENSYCLLPLQLKLIFCHCMQRNPVHSAEANWHRPRDRKHRTARTTLARARRSCAAHPREPPTGSFSSWFPGRGGRGQSKAVPLASWEGICVRITISHTSSGLSPAGSAVPRLLPRDGDFGLGKRADLSEITLTFSPQCYPH